MAIKYTKGKIENIDKTAIVMVTPKKPSNSKASVDSSSTTSLNYILVAVKILLVLVILLLLPRLVTSSRRQTTKQLASRNRLECEVDCLEYIPEESMNCIFKCMSKACYSSVYGDSPLEPGEVDVKRMDKFRECAEREMKIARRQQTTKNPPGTGEQK